jgi:DNA-binding PucR family transcriptional regulator
VLALLVPTAEAPRVITALGTSQESSVLRSDEADGLRSADRISVLLVPLFPRRRSRSRADVLAQLRGSPVVIGPERDWAEAATSYRRALRCLRRHGIGQHALDTEEQLAELVITADQAALRDLRLRALAPLDGLRPAARDKLVRTLRAYLLNHGRREAMAADLFVHPQTVRYRMGQLRELFGDQLKDAQRVAELTIAVAIDEES